MEKERFFPSGAIAFFTALIGFYIVIWFLMFWIMVSRG